MILWTQPAAGDKKKEPSTDGIHQTSIQPSQLMDHTDLILSTHQPPLYKRSINISIDIVRDITIRPRISGTMVS
jgi:hypothetical protein